MFRFWDTSCATAGFWGRWSPSSSEARPSWAWHQCLPAYAEQSLGYPVWVGGGALLAFSVAMALGRMVVGAAGIAYPRISPDGRLPRLPCCCFSRFLRSIRSIGPGGLHRGGICRELSLAHDAGGVRRSPSGGWRNDVRSPRRLGMPGHRDAVGGRAIADHSDLRHGLAFSAVAPALMLPLVAALRRRAAVTAGRPPPPSGPDA